MNVSLDNAVKAVSEYLSQELSNMQPSLMNAAMGIFSQYKLQTQGRKLLSSFDDGNGKINIDVLDNLVKQYTANMPDQSFRTPLGDIKITGDTPIKLMEHIKKYGEN